MKSLYILGLALSLISSVHAQDANPESIPDAEQIQKAIDEFNRNRKSKEAEVKVVLPPPNETETTPRAVPVEEEPKAEDPKPEESKPEEPEKKKPVLVSGKPPEPKKEETTDPDESKPGELKLEEPNPDTEKPEEKKSEEIVTPEPPETPEPSNVRVESIRSGSGKIDPKNIEIKSSFPTKALTPPPAGWKLETSEQAPAFTRQVEIKPGVFISLEITPHILSPEADGAKLFSVTEPGYNHQKGYEQDQSVANILESSINQLEADSIKMGSALSELHQLLASLPKPEISAPNSPPPIKP
jgi:hypothetical protein